jgi:hypothetical protein
MLVLNKHIIKLPTAKTLLSPRIAENPKYAQYFTDCLGALDGTHIDDQARYQNHKGHLSQNVLAACNFEMEFTYILAGWEGSAHDGTVYCDAVYNQGFITLPGKYWLGDAGYPNSDTVLVPYQSTQYHLKEQRLAGKKPENSKELFNLRHASLWNIIERIFGVVKRKYQILQQPAEYSIETQTRIILACLGLHNWVRSIEGEKADFWLDTEKSTFIDIQPVVAYPEGTITSRKMDKFRDEIAEKMWTDYCRYNKEKESI